MTPDPGTPPTDSRKRKGLEAGDRGKGIEPHCDVGPLFGRCFGGYTEYTMSSGGLAIHTYEPDRNQRGDRP
jgi:hypothetical protein